MAHRLKKELEDIEFRIAQGLDRCDQFFDDEYLLKCRHSRSKTLILLCRHLEAPLDFYTRALKGNDDVISIYFHYGSDQQYDWFAKTICDLPSSVTSISGVPLPPIQRDTPLFICDDTSTRPDSLEIFLNDDESLACTRDTHVFIQQTLRIQVIAVSFVGPSSGNLILRIKHRTHGPDKTLTCIILGTSFTLTIPQSLTIDDINLHPIGVGESSSESSSESHLSFIANTRNNLMIHTSVTMADHYYVPQDLQLLDEDGNRYGLPSRRNIPATDFDALSISDDRESWNIEFDALRTPDDRKSGDSKSQQECPSSGHGDLLADTNPVVAAGDDTTFIK
jgi:hypothetical protein